MNFDHYFKRCVSTFTIVSLVLACSTTNTAQNTSVSQKSVVAKKYAVLLIDASVYKDKGSSRWIDLEQELLYMGEVLQKANQQNIPVFEITFNDCSIWDSAAAGCYEKITDPNLTKYRASNWVRIKKDYADSFHKTKLNRYLSKQAITDVLVMGFSQKFCVKKTVESGNKLGYTIHTSFDVIQELAGDKCELLINGVSQGISIDNCKIKPDPFQGIEVRRAEHWITESRLFYNKNTKLVTRYAQLPIFKN